MHGSLQISGRFQTAIDAASKLVFRLKIQYTKNFGWEAFYG